MTDKERLECKIQEHGDEGDVETLAFVELLMLAFKRGDDA